MVNELELEKFVFRISSSFLGSFQNSFLDENHSATFGRKGRSFSGLAVTREEFYFCCFPALAFFDFVISWNSSILFERT